jgi:2-C-methyl-D-erythritol 4-phosphate cytidylyltransferase
MAMPTLVVPAEGRGTLPFALLHGRALLLHAVQTLRRLGPLTVTAGTDHLDEVRGMLGRERDVTVALADDFWAVGRPRVLVHDCLCPLAPEAWLRTVAGSAGPAVAVRPVTDTLKVVDGDTVGGTIDRGRFSIVTSPLLLVDVDGRPPTEDPSALVTWMRGRGDVEILRAPQLARRVADSASVSVMESVDALRRELRED